MMKKTVSKDEVLFYLEEMMSVGLANDVEEELYEQLMYGTGVCKTSLQYVTSRMYEWYQNKF